MQRIAIYGAGGLGREVAASLKDLVWANPEGWELIGFFDDGRPKAEQVGDFGTILGGMRELNEWSAPLNVALCFGEPRTIAMIRKRITNPLVSFPNLIDKDYFVSDLSTFSIGEGNIIHSGCRVTTNVCVGDFNLLNGDVVYGHDTRVGNYNVFMPGCRISGKVTIGNECLLGAMSFVKQQLTLGDGVRLGPLSALLTKPRTGATYVGNPAKMLKY